MSIKLERAVVGNLDKKFNLLLKNFDSLMKTNDLSNRNLLSEGEEDTTSNARSAEVKLLNRKNFENNSLESNRNRMNFENEELMVEYDIENHGKNIVGNSSIETLIA